MSIPRICNYEDCSKPFSAKGYCKTHYARLHKYGDVNIVKKVPKHHGLCKISGCERTIKSLYLCSMHYQRLKSSKKMEDPNQIQYRHGLSKHTLYSTWEGMRDRCNNPNKASFKDYGGRGIKICKRWDNFAMFIEDMGVKPSPRHTLDRIDVNGDYEPSNCRWATRQQQSINTRDRKVNNSGYRNIRYNKKSETYEVVITRSYYTLQEALEERDYMLRKKPE